MRLVESYGSRLLSISMNDEYSFQLNILHFHQMSKDMAKGAEEIFDQLWTLPAAGVSYTYNACITVAAKDPFRGLESLISVYDYLIHSLADPRVSDWPLMSNPVCIFICIIICFFSTRCRKNRAKSLVSLTFV